MIRRLVRRGLRRLGYDLVKLTPGRRTPPGAEPPAVGAVWPLPRGGELSGDEVRAAFACFPHWHYAYEFEGGLAFKTSHQNAGLDTDDPRRPLQRFRHFMPYLVESQGGTLRGKRVLDIACNSGFWSIQCALLGAEVIGFDARPELIAQANLIKQITAAETATFRVLDFWQMTPEALGGTFDVVLNLGVLYHLPKPLDALELTKAMTRGHILLDTATHPSTENAIYLNWEEPFDIRAAAGAGVVAFPTRAAVELLLRHLGVKRSIQIPVRTNDLPLDYHTGKRASWLIEV
jgi:SAM-dependent methyltransferase